MASALAALALPSAALAAPATPTALQVNATGPQQVALSWTAPSGTVSGYHVYRNGTLVNTTDANTTNFLDSGASLTNGTSYAYTVDAYDGSGNSAQSSAASGTPHSAFAFTTCGGSTELTPSHVTLGNNMTITNDEPCFNFTDGANLSLDCGGHSITQNSNGDILEISNISGVIISNCTFVMNTAGGQFARVVNSPYATFVNDTFTVPANPPSEISGASLNIQTSPHGVIGEQGKKNTFTNSYVELNDSPSTYLGYNDVTEVGKTNPVGIWVNRSDQSVVVHNTVDGGYPGFPAPDSGLDDAIDMQGPNDALTISWNTLSHVFDAGIEPETTLKNSHIDHNIISYAGESGIGEYHNTDFHDNVLIGNQIDHAPHAFEFSVDYNSYWPLPPSFSTSSNTFSNNVWTSPLGADPYGGLLSAVVLGITQVEHAETTPWGATNNVFVNNDFGQLGAPFSANTFNPSDAANTAASTGNLCPSTATATISCGGPAVVSRGAGPSKNGGGSWTVRGHVDAHGALATTKIQYGLTTSYGTTLTSSNVSATSPQDVSAVVPPKPDGTVVHYRVVATNSYGVVNGPDQVFVVPASGGRPLVSNGPEMVRADSSGAWLLQNFVDPQGSATTTKIQWGTTTSYNHTVNSAAVPTGSPQDVSIVLPAQTPGTTIHYRTIATNTTGVSNGADQTFVVPSGAPGVTAGPAPVHNGDGSWTVYGYVDPQGLGARAVVQWGNQTDWTSVDPYPHGTTSIVNAGTPTNVSVTIPAQPSGTTIHYRTYANNLGGINYGTDRTITVP